MKILLLEDDKLFSDTLKDFLEDEGFAVDLALDPYTAYDLAYENSYDLYLFDINLPFESGIEALRSLKNSGDGTPVIFITSRDDKNSLIEGFNAGADDYIKKPVDLDELLLRINAVLKRTKKSDKIELGDYVLDREQKEIFYKNEPLKLGFRIYLLLELLVDNAGRAVSYEEIYEKLWGESEPNKATIRVYMVKLKNLFPEAIESVRGFGYIFHSDRV